MGARENYSAGCAGANALQLAEVVLLAVSCRCAEARWSTARGVHDGGSSVGRKLDALQVALIAVGALELCVLQLSPGYY